MATLALSVAGAAAGSFTGIGAGAGWQIGSTLGQIFFPEERQAGSRLSDLKISGASYGAVIPTLFGTMRMGGNVIWAAPLESRAVSTETGGKGGAAAPAGASGYEYFASFSIGLAQGEVGALLKIWADGKVIYDISAAGEVRVPGLHFRFYRGDENQLADSVIVAEQGTGNVPGYRGLAYLVFDSLPLTEYGNRIPNIEVLLSTEGVSHFPAQEGAALSLDASSLSYDPLRGQFFTYEVTGGVDKMRKIDLASLSILHEVTVGTDFPRLPSSNIGFSRDRNGNFWIGTGFGFLAGRKLTRFNSQAMTIEAEAELPSTVGALSWSADVVSSLTGVAFQAMGSQQNGQVVLIDPSLDVVSLIATDSPACSGALTDRNEIAWIAMSGIVSTSPVEDLQIVSVGVTATQGISGVSYGTVHHIHTIPAADLTPLGGTGSETNTVTRLVANLESQRELVFQNDYRIFKWSKTTGALTATRDGTSFGKILLTDTNDGQALVYIRDNRWLVYLSAESLQQSEEVDLYAFAGVNDFNKVIYDALSDSVVLLSNSAPLRRLYLRRKNGAEAGIPGTVQSLTTAAGLPLSDVDVSEISGAVPGYILNRPMSVQDALQPLLQAGNFDLSESGYQLKFKAANDSATMEISEGELLAPLSSQRLQESELPGSVSLSYMAADGGYQAGTQMAKRNYAPKSTMFGRNEIKMDLPMALTAKGAKAICQQNLFAAWSGRVNLSAGLPTRYLALDAADVVTVRQSGGNIKARINQTYLGADFSLEIQATGIGGFTATGEAPADTGSGYSQILIERPSFAELFILDLPLLRDEDATGGAGSRYYFAMDGYGTSWRGAGLYASDTGERYEPRGVSESEICWGVAMTALGDTDTPWQTDRANKLTVRFLNGADRLESVTEAALLSGANALLVGDEVIQFREVSANPDGSYDLTTLLRGRRGSESYTGRHEVGEKVVLLEADRMGRDVMPLAYLSIPYSWKAVGAGQLIEDVPAQIKPLTGRDLKPYAPVHIQWSRTPDDLTLVWTRRTRVGGGSLNGPIPVSEAAERYELSFEYDGKTITKFVEGSPGYVYARTDFNEDFASSLPEIPTLDVTIYQLSETIGRGCPAKERV